MRYRKSIKICKGLRINLSGSGMSVTAGIPGLSVTTGKRGTYLNTGIPGTGLSNRTKISGGKSSARTSRSAAVQPPLQFRLKVSEAGEISCWSMDGSPIVDPELVSRIKRTPEYRSLRDQVKETQHAEMSKKMEEADDAVEQLIHINRQCPDVLTEPQLELLLSKFEPQRYERQEFSLSPPDEAEIREELTNEAKANVKGFFGRKKKIDEYVYSRLDQVLEDRKNMWEKEKRNFEKSEDIVEARTNKAFQEEYRLNKEMYDKAFAGEKQAIYEVLELTVGEIELPLDFSLDYHYAEDGIMWLDLDLPEIEDMPQTKYVELKSGTIKEKNKTQKEVREDYARCVFGIGLYLSSVTLNVSPAIKSVCISGYTQRRNRDGDICDDYVYSLLLPREEMVQTVLKSSDVLDLAMKFKNRCKMTSTFMLKTIKPYAEDDIEDI